MDKNKIVDLTILHVHFPTILISYNAMWFFMNPKASSSNSVTPKIANHGNKLKIFILLMYIFSWMCVDYWLRFLFIFSFLFFIFWKIVLKLCSRIVSFWITLARSKENKYHIFWQYCRNVPVFTNTGTFQYVGPQVYFSIFFLGGGGEDADSNG